MNGDETEKAPSLTDGLSAVCAARSAVGCECEPDIASIKKSQRCLRYPTRTRTHAGLQTGAQTAGMAVFRMPAPEPAASLTRQATLRTARAPMPDIHDCQNLLRFVSVFSVSPFVNLLRSLRPLRELHCHDAAERGT